MSLKYLHVAVPRDLLGCAASDMNRAHVLVKVEAETHCTPDGISHPEVGLDYMGTPDFQLASGFAIMRHFVALIIHDAHVCEQVWPALTHPVLHLFFSGQFALAALQSHTDR